MDEYLVKELPYGKNINEISFHEITDYLFCLIVKEFKLNTEDVIKKNNHYEIEISFKNERITVISARSCCLNRLEFYLRDSLNPAIMISAGYTLESGDFIPFYVSNPFKSFELSYPLLRINGEIYVDEKSLNLPTSPLLVEFIKSLILPVSEWINHQILSANRFNNAQV